LLFGFVGVYTRLGSQSNCDAEEGLFTAREENLQYHNYWLKGCYSNADTLTHPAGPRRRIRMVRKEQCPQCKGNKVIAINKESGKDTWAKCPSCGGQGYRVRLLH
jgi:hypothetical protein